jgi:hypothetical protein
MVIKRLVVVGENMRGIGTRGIAFIAACLVAGSTTASVPSDAGSSARYVDLATPFEQAAIETAGQPQGSRVATIRERINAVLPGIYRRDASTDRLIADALVQYPAKRAAYNRAVAEFAVALSGAVKRFRKIFPEFKSNIPIYLYHSLGLRDGGSDYLDPGKRHVMLFGADMIAEYHSDDSLQPFLAHELFHLEHERHFSDCDQFWCAIWQEGLAVDAAATMTPRATDRQLLLDTPKPIRPKTEARWKDALCFAAAHFDDTDGTAVVKALQMGGNPPNELPDRFGYYVGYRIAQATNMKLIHLSRLDNKSARPVVRSALIKLMNNAEARCPLPAVDAVVTQQSPNPV